MGDELNFRALLIQLQDGLSDRDRQRLHFLLGDLIPAHLRDDLTMGGTLNLLQNLLNRDKVSEQDVTFLIQVFYKIHCRSIVQILKQHQESQQQGTNVPESSRQSSTLLDRLLDDTNDDRIALSKGMDRMIKLEPVNSTIKLSPTTTTTSLSPRHVSSANSLKSVETKSSSFNRFYGISKKKTSKYAIPSLLLNFIFFMLGITLFIVYFTRRSPSIQCVDHIYHLKNGAVHGGSGGGVFDDAKDYGLTYGDRCIAVQIHWSSGYLYSIRFIYNTSSQLYQTHSNKPRGEDVGSGDIFNLSLDEEINKIIVTNAVLPTNTPNVTLHLITGIQFFTTKQQSSKKYGIIEESSAPEFYPDYTLFYVKGRSGKYIDQLQFVWSKTCLRTKSQECMPK